MMDSVGFGVDQPQVVDSSDVFRASPVREVGQANANGEAASDIRWTLVSTTDSGTSRADDFLDVSFMDDAPQSDTQPLHGLRAAREWADYGVSASRAAGHVIGRLTGGLVGLSVAGMHALLHEVLDHSTEDGPQSTRPQSIVSDAERGLQMGANTGDWLGGYIGQGVANVLTFGAPAMLAYLDRTLNGADV